MNMYMKIAVIAGILCLMTASAVSAEVIYLNDGQVITGTIVAETTDDITVKTKYQTRRIRRADVTRIMYGERKMERITLLMNDGTTIKGFLVDQDAEKYIIRDKENSAEERNIPKSSVAQTSGGDIVPLAPTIMLRGGVFYPVNSDGAKFKPAAFGMLSGDVTFRWIPKMRVIAEVGFSRCEGDAPDLYGQFVPLLVGGYYDFAFGAFHLQPKLTLGTTMFDFNDGEGSSDRSFAFSACAGLGLVYEVVDRHFYVGLWPEYYLVRDSSAGFHCVAATLSAGYRF